jgi:hypothetical protein
MKAVRRGVGGTLLLTGLGWLGYMFWLLDRLNRQLVPSWDIGLTYWYPTACVTFPLAFGLVVGGWRLIRGGVQIARSEGDR